MKTLENSISGDLLIQLDNILHCNTNVTWRDILNTTQSLWNIMNDEHLIHYFNPEKISDELINFGVDKQELAFQN